MARALPIAGVAVRGGGVDAFLAAWSGRPSVAVVDLDQLATNIRQLRATIGPATRLMAVVKANAYGHGAVMIARHARACGVAALGVATVDEGVQLRSAGITGEVLVLGPTGAEEGERAARHGLSLVVASAEAAEALAAGGRRAGGGAVPVHLKVDTGMHRYGCPPAEAVHVARAIVARGELQWAGVMTHLAAADSPDPTFTREQARCFDAVVDTLRAAGLALPPQHVANSAGTLRFPDLHRDMVRVGIALYGLRTDPGLPLPGAMAPVLSVRSRLARVFALQPGDTVSYGRTYGAAGDEHAGLVPIGYGDGYPRALSNRGAMAIDGRPARVLGRVTMDQTVVRIPDGMHARRGDRVVVVGDGTAASRGAPTLDELATQAGTIGYELATGLAARLPKLYVAEGRVIAVDDLAGLREVP